MQENDDNARQRSENRKKPALNFLLMGAGSMFTSMVIAGFVVGYILDALFDTLPVFLMICGLLGFIGGLLKVNKLLGKMDLLDPQKPAKAADRNETPPVTEEPMKDKTKEKNKEQQR
ncbi:MAG: AtpZ/AtpI family protein [Hydrogenovibrio sp.]|uniref:AtpZ/AtpI family protein n=1 Tax=Hydrogenovibrio sp. TaxID=2065821 RepID=UPI00286FCE58|nr:AtpZ/AtpI family protein [Hydrogenovibrio sp.]MDR9498744.1 AtpZ/AtpI family protein [Hydrogenovibrio sp.]